MNLDVTFIALVVLVTLSAGGVAYALMFGRIQQEKATAQRFSRVQTRQPRERGAAARATDPTRRRKSLQETLKELEADSKPKNANTIPLNRRLEQAGLGITKRGFYVISAIIGLVAFGGAFISGLPPYAWFVAALAVGLGLPRWVVSFLRKRRFKKFQNEFANAIDVIVRGVKAGLPLNDCIQIVGREAREPVAAEFRRLTEAQKLGVSIADAVDRMPDHVPIAEVNFFAIVIGIQQRAGGNLSEALGNLSGVLRDRKRMLGKIKAMSMEAKASGVIIAALPFVVMVMVYLTSPDYIMLLFTERLGHLMLGAGAFWMLMGVLVMRKMINFDF